jgi:hypothetical protein
VGETGRSQYLHDAAGWRISLRRIAFTWMLLAEAALLVVPRWSRESVAIG